MESIFIQLLPAGLTAAPLVIVGMVLMVIAAVINGFKYAWINLMGYITYWLSRPWVWFIVIYYFLNKNGYV